MLFGQGGLENLDGYKSSHYFFYILFLAFLYVSMCAATDHFCHLLLTLFSPLRHQKLGAKTRWMSRNMKSTPKWVPSLLARLQSSTSLQVYGELG